MLPRSGQTAAAPTGKACSTGGAAWPTGRLRCGCEDVSDPLGPAPPDPPAHRSRPCLAAPGVVTVSSLGATNQNMEAMEAPTTVKGDPGTLGYECCGVTKDLWIKGVDEIQPRTSVAIKSINQSSIMWKRCKRDCMVRTYPTLATFTYPQNFTAITDTEKGVGCRWWSLAKDGACHRFRSCGPRGQFFQEEGRQVLRQVRDR
jgi:hypothetical protein